MMRKQAGKSAQRRKGNENPAPKRRKTGEDNKYEESRRTAIMVINQTMGEKRKSDGKTPTNHEHEHPNDETEQPS